MPRKSKGITRRDFLNGVAVAIGAGFFHGCSSPDPSTPTGFAPELAPEYYPPSLTGIRGNHQGSFEAFHELRDGSFDEKSRRVKESVENYDLIIVGAGISGLSAAHFYRQQKGTSSKILILDNHDDFGGHAKRNEFRIGNRTILGYGGTFSIDSPAPYSRIAQDLITGLGINVHDWHRFVDWNIYSSLGLHPSIFFDRKTFGADRLIRFPSGGFWEEEAANEMDEKQWIEFLKDAPLSQNAKRDIVQLHTGTVDYLPGLSSDEKKSKLARISYADFLLNLAKADPDVVKFFQCRLHGLYGVGIDAIPAQDAWGLGLPGFAGMKLDDSYGRGMNRDAIRDKDGGESYFFHFPDGNATIARLLVRQMIPAAIPGRNLNDLIHSRCNYAKLDSKNSPVRIRLNSTAVKVENQPDGNVHVDYLRGGEIYRVRAGKCILACWNSVIPYLCPQLPDQQKQDLLYETKVPLLYTNVLLSNWKAFAEAGVSNIHCPGSYHSGVSLDLPVSFGDYRCSQKPDEPIVVHMMRTPCSPGLSARQQHRAGRLELLNTPFETYEQNIRKQLESMLRPYGFDASRDIRAITVNRWAHGYAYQYNSLFDPFWLNGDETPCERARKPFGSISIANADAGAYAYTDSAIDQAYRAVSEII